MILRFFLTASIAVTCASSAMSVPILVASRVAQDANDGMDWGALGPSGTKIPDGTNGQTSSGITVTVDHAGPSAGEIRVQGVTWAGNFAHGDSVLWNNNNGPTTLSFSSSIFGVGFQVMSNNGDLFSGQVEAFDALNNSLGVFKYSGFGNSDDDNSAVYIGLRDTTASISKVVITGLTALVTPNDFAINRLSINGPVAPELDGSTALAPISFVLMSLLTLTRRRRR